MRYSCNVLYVIGPHKDKRNDSLHKGQHFFFDDKRKLVNRHRRDVPVEIRIDGTHGRRQRRVCTNLGGRIQPISRENQEASFSVNSQVLSRVGFRTVVVGYGASGHTNTNLAPLLLEGLLTQRSFAEISNATQSLQTYGLLMIY